MSFERNLFGFDGELTFVCDECGEEHHTQTANFHEAVRLIKSEGWRVSKDKDDDWTHTCADCADPENDFGGVEDFPATMSVCQRCGKVDPPKNHTCCPNEMYERFS